MPVLIEYFRAVNIPDLTVVSPDAGGVERARAFAKRLDSPLAIIDKRRTEANVAEVMHIIGEAEGQDRLIVDALTDTVGTLLKAGEALLQQGAKRLRAWGTASACGCIVARGFVRCGRQRSGGGRKPQGSRPDSQ